MLQLIAILDLLRSLPPASFSFQPRSLPPALFAVVSRTRKQQQQVERGGFSPFGTLIGLDSRDPFDLQLGARLFYNNTSDMLWRRKMEEQADLQQPLELQCRRLMGQQLFDVKKHYHHRALFTSAVQFLPPPTLPIFSIKFLSFLHFTAAVQKIYKVLISA